MFKNKEIEELKLILKDTFSKIKLDMDANKNQISELANENKKLRELLNNDEIKKEISVLRGREDKLTEELALLKEKTGTLGFNPFELTSLKREIANLKKNDNYNARISSLNSRVNITRRAISEHKNLLEATNTRWGRKLYNLKQEIAETKLASITKKEISYIKDEIDNINSRFEKTVNINEFNKIIEMNQRLCEYIQGLESRVNDLIETRMNVEPSLNEFVDEHPDKANTKNVTDAIKSQLIKKIDRNKKNIIMQKILDVIKTKQVTLPELKEIIVDEHSYCSKASFYRYFEDMKARNMVNLLDINNLRVVMPTQNQAYRDTT